ncbi:TadE family protein [Nocardioides sp. HDW12B]|uniref:TadE family protein n=1 Tax=Nocardioides sp. HDW12B TaxID=2714939 RepID=UPI001F0DC0D5|nr:TadE family protein [Nocardioides sp. HDW12B]
MDFVLVVVVVVPLFLGILQVGLVLHVRNTLTSAASEGARYGARFDREPSDGAARAREAVSDAVSGRFARDVTARRTTLQGAPAVTVEVRGEVPALGLFGPAWPVRVSGHAVEEVAP